MPFTLFTFFFLPALSLSLVYLVFILQICQKHFYIFPPFSPMSSLELALVAVYAKEVHSNLWAAIYRKNKASKCNFLIAASHTRFCTEQTGDHVEFFFFSFEVIFAQTCNSLVLPLFSTLGYPSLYMVLTTEPFYDVNPFCNYSLFISSSKLVHSLMKSWIPGTKSLRS